MFTVKHNIGGGPEVLAETYASYLPGAKIERFASPDTFRWTGLLATSNGRALWRIRSNSDWDFISGTGEERHVFVTLPECGDFRLVDGGQERLAGVGQAVVLHLPADQDNRAFCSRNHARTSLRWTTCEVERAVSSMFEDVRIGDLGPQPVLDLRNDRGEVIRRLLSAIAIDLTNPLSASTLASELMNEAVLRLLFEPAVCRQMARRRVRILPRHVKLAIDYMHANISKPIRIRDVADACCVTPRSLENAFRTFKGTTPIAFLRRLRLDAVHHELQDKDQCERVSAIARRWGFSDLGRFAERYRRAFGELPSETLLRR